ncbi:MAG: carboxypeptidase M32 [Thermoguttaceae bacterium]
MSQDTARLYSEICEHARRTAMLASINETLGWDERTHLPPAGGDYRAEQSTLLAGLIHQSWVDAKFGEQLDQLAAKLKDPNDPQDDAAVVVRRLKRQRDKRVKLPQTLVEELARTAILGQQAWQVAREKDDFPSFRPLLERMVELKRQQAEALGYPQCPYDALLDEFEPEELTANVGKVLARLREALVPLVAKIQASGRRPDTSVLHRKFPADAQERLGREASAAIGFDFNRGQLDVTAHPFCSTLGPNDSRITTRYDEQFFNTAFFGILHESGHGIYDQGLPREHFGLPLGDFVSLGIHESQSRMWENLVGRSRAFWAYFYPKVQQYFPAALADVSLDTFHFAVNDVRPSLIRIEADEATYNLHILIRFELERALLEKQIEAADLPEAWNQRYQQYLGITPPDDRQGVLQDVHWSAGLIGYFPTYSLGNLYAAQFFAKAEADLGILPESFARGDFRPLLTWLRENVHRHGQRYSAAELVKRATGQPLSPRPLVNHLTTTLGALYGI